MRKTLMASNGTHKPHVVCVPAPAQGHITPMLKLSKLLHFRGFHITFVNTHYNHRRLLHSLGSSALHVSPDFHFEAIPDGLPESDTHHGGDATQDVPSLCDSTSKNCLAPFRQLLRRINSNGSSPPVSGVIADGDMSFCLDAAAEFGVPCVVFWTNSACGVLGYSKYRELIQRGFTPLKDTSDLANGYLDTVMDWIPGMENIRLRDLPSFIRTTDINDIMLNFQMSEAERTKRASAVILNTFDSFETDALSALSTVFPPIYTIGPLNFLVEQLPSDYDLKNMGSSLWKEESECIRWLDSKEPNSVVYVNFGSIAVVTPEQMTEFAWGLARSEKPFLWVIRPDLVKGESAMLPPEFFSETQDRSTLTSWCAQEQVLKHPSVGVFLSHMGWNSTLDSICAGVPMICWPFFAEQPTNCWFACNKWGMGTEIDNNVKREEVEKLVRKLIDGEEGKEMKMATMEWKRKAEEATANGGSSQRNLDQLIKLLQANKLT